MTSILVHPPDQAAFKPDLRIISRAFDGPCNALHLLAGAQAGREAVAARINDLASSGVIGGAALRDRVVSAARRLEGG